MVKYEEGFKRAVVQEYLAGPQGFKSIAAKHGINDATLRSWVAGYRQHGDAGLRKKRGYYSAQFKLSVLHRIWQESLSYRRAAALFDLRGGTGVITTWERQYHEGGLSALEPRFRGRPKKMPTSELPKPLPSQPDDARSHEELLEEVKYLRAEVAYLKKLRALLQAKEHAAQKKRR
jgi:transposase